MVKRREKDWNDSLVSKYYAEQSHMDAAENSAQKDDVRRREREARERQVEHDMVEHMLRVRHIRELPCISPATTGRRC